MLLLFFTYKLQELCAFLHTNYLDILFLHNKWWNLRNIVKLKINNHIHCTDTHMHIIKLIIMNLITNYSWEENKRLRISYKYHWVWNLSKDTYKTIFEFYVGFEEIILIAFNPIPNLNHII